MLTVYPYDISYNELMEQQPDGVILSSGPGDPHQVKTLSLDPKNQWSDSDLGHGLGSTGTGSSLRAELAPMEVGISA